MKNVATLADLEDREYKLFNFRPALFAAIFLAVGILYAYFRLKVGASLWWLAGLPLSGLLFIFFGKDGRERLYRFGTCIGLALFVLGGGVGLYVRVQDYQAAPVYQGEYTVLGTVESCTKREYDVQLLLRDVFIGDKEVEGKLNAYLPATYDFDLQIADKVILQGEVATNTAFFDEYGVRASALAKNLCYTMSATDYIEVGRSNNPFLRVRSRMAKVLSLGMDETPAGLTLALLTGDTSGMDEGLVENIRMGGISHIFAVSGLNVGALYAFCMLAFTKTPLRRVPSWIRYLLLLGVLFFYSGVCSFSSSVVRAAIFCAVGYFVRSFGNRADMLNALGISAIIILCITPSELFGVGFQLSYLACFGLFFLAKGIGQVLDEIKNFFLFGRERKRSEEEKKLLADGDTLPETFSQSVWRGTRTVLSVSLAAQIATAPALLYYFGFLSGWGLLLNFFFVPLLDAAFSLLLAVVSIACVLPNFFAPLLLYLPSVLWSALMLLFEVVDFSSFALTGVQVTVGVCVCYCMGIIFLSEKWNLPLCLRASISVLYFLASTVMTVLVNL